MQISENSSESQRKRTPLQDKWGESLRQGFVTIPWVLLRRQQDLGLDSHDLVVLLHLIGSWWEADDAPYPSSQTMAKRMDVSVRTVQRSLKKLQTKGLLTKQVQELANDGATLVTRYDLTPLAAKLAHIVTVQVKQAKEAQHADRLLQHAALA